MLFHQYLFHFRDREQPQLRVKEIQLPLRQNCYQRFLNGTVEEKKYTLQEHLTTGNKKSHWLRG